MLVKFTKRKKTIKRKKWSCPNYPPGWKDKRLSMFCIYRLKNAKVSTDWQILCFSLRLCYYESLEGIAEVWLHFQILFNHISQIHSFQNPESIWKLSRERVKAHHTIFVSAPQMTPHFFLPHLFSSGHCSCVLKYIFYALTFYSNLGIAM